MAGRFAAVQGSERGRSRCPASGNAWRITAGDLERVLVAAFIGPAIWASMSGQPGLPTLTELRASDFWSFFHISQSARDDSDPTYVSITLQTGGFSEHNAIQLRCNEKDEICSAVLRLRQSWVFGPPYGINPFATDIAASWLATLVPQTDRPKLDPLIGELRSLRLDERLKENSQRAEWSRSDVGRLVAAYLGLDRPFVRVLPGPFIPDRRDVKRPRRNRLDAASADARLASRRQPVRTRPVSRASAGGCRGCRPARGGGRRGRARSSARRGPGGRCRARRRAPRWSAT